MTSRERLLCALDNQIPDRVPLGIWATPEVWARLREHFSVATNQAVEEQLHVDRWVGLGAPYLGPPPPAAPPGYAIDYWGRWSRPVDYGTGTYWEQCRWPLAEVTSVAELDEHPWPSPDWFDYQAVRRQALALRGEAVIESGYFAPFFFYNLQRGLEASLLDLAAEPELAHAIVDRLGDFFYGCAERLYDTCHGLIDVGQLTDDYGSQTNLLISPAVFDEYFLPHYRRIAKLMRDHGVRVFHHDDGAMWPLIPRLVEVGVQVLNPIQYKCGPIELAWLNETWGDRLAFHGGVDNQEILPFGTPDQVREEVRHCLRDLAPGGGYILAPCHNLQPVTPTENILAMYQTAWDEGWY